MAVWKLDATIYYLKKKSYFKLLDQTQANRADYMDCYAKSMQQSASTVCVAAHKIQLYDTIDPAASQYICLLLIKFNCMTQSIQQPVSTARLAAHKIQFPDTTNQQPVSTV